MAERQSYSEQNYFSIDSYPYGRSYGQWTVEWWRWFLSTPKSINPVLDRSGEYAAVNQPPSDVWFLAGKLGDEDSDLPSRFCSIPKGRSILFPIINCQANFLEDPELKTEQEIIDHVTADENTIVEKVCILDDKSIPAQRVKSDPLLFEFTINEDNIFNVQGAKSTIAHGDGYWIFLKPLSIGIHKLSFQGSCEKGRLKSGANYKLEVKDH
jgi:hypothetical protein